MSAAPGAQKTYGSWTSTGIIVFPSDAWSYDTKSSFLGGGTLGCNWQPIGSPFVLGIEGELGYLRLTGSAIDPFDSGSFSINSHTKIGDWYGMVAGRLGYAWDRALLYVKGGVAFVDVETTVTDPLVNPGFVASTSDSTAAWTVGGGIEWAFDWNWSVKAEYMFIGLDNKSACGFDRQCRRRGPSELTAGIMSSMAFTPPRSA